MEIKIDEVNLGEMKIVYIYIYHMIIKYFLDTLKSLTQINVVENPF